MNKIFYWNAFQRTWVLIPDKVQEFLETIPQIQVLHNEDQSSVEIKLLRQDMTKEERANLPKVVR